MFLFHSVPLSRRALSLIEVLVTLTIFTLMAAFMFAVVQTIMSQWKASEQRRSAYEKAGALLDVMADDIRLAAPREALGGSEVKIKFIGDWDPDSPLAQRQRLMFVRAFEAGPERALVSNAGDGRANPTTLNADPSADPPAANKIDIDYFDGLKIGDYKALGGLAMIGYFVKNKTLYRAVKAPAEGSLAALCDPAAAQPLDTDVLYLAFDYWSQETESWDEPPRDAANKNSGPQKIWDSTRGINVPPLSRFFLHRGAISLNDSEDDVIPRKVRITLNVDATFPRCLYTRILDEIGESDTTIYVDKDRGFPDGGEEDSYIIIDDEWMHYSKRGNDSFTIDKRGARNTLALSHKREAVVRTGKTFQRVVFIPNWREDFTPDEVYFTRKQARQPRPNTLMKGKGS